MVLVDAAPPPDAWPEGCLLFEEEEPFVVVEPDADEEDSALVGVPVARFDPVGGAALETLLLTLFWVVIAEAELLVLDEESCVPCAVDPFALEDAVSVVTAVAAEVFLPDVGC